MKSLFITSQCLWLIWFCPPASIAQAHQNNQTNSESSSTKKETRKAIITSKPEPKYPSEASGEKVIVYVKMIFRSTGKVTDIQASRVSPEDLPDRIKQAFMRESLKASDGIEFIPAVKEGRPVSQYVLVEYHFNP